MRRPASLGATVFSALALVFAPWIGPVSPRAVAPTDEVLFMGTPLSWLMPRAAQPETPEFTRPRSACNCRTVRVNMRNDVSNAEVRTGDAKVVNYNITYVSAAFGDREVDVDQEAEAVSGDAIAGQLINVDARGPGCVNVEVNAVNRVRDSIVRTGDATAINKSIVLLDPGVSRGDLEIDVEQEALAVSGDAIAGQVIGLVGGGGGAGCRGGVALRAVNEVTDTKVRSGEASFLNESEIRTCAEQGCADELRRLLGAGRELEVCRESRCRDVDTDELGALLGEAGLDEGGGGDEGDGDESVASRAAADCGAESASEPGPTASPTPDGTPPAPTTAPESPAPSATPVSSAQAPCVSPAPSPTPSPALLAASDSRASRRGR